MKVQDMQTSIRKEIQEASKKKIEEKFYGNNRCYKPNSRQHRNSNK